MNNYQRNIDALLYAGNALSAKSPGEFAGHVLSLHVLLSEYDEDIAIAGHVRRATLWVSQAERHHERFEHKMAVEAIEKATGSLSIVHALLYHENV